MAFVSPVIRVLVNTYVEFSTESLRGFLKVTIIHKEPLSPDTYTFHGGTQILTDHFINTLTAFIQQVFIEMIDTARCLDLCMG